MIEKDSIEFELSKETDKYYVRLEPVELCSDIQAFKIVYTPNLLLKLSTPMLEELRESKDPDSLVWSWVLEHVRESLK